MAGQLIVIVYHHPYTHCKSLFFSHTEKCVWGKVAYEMLRSSHRLFHLHSPTLITSKHAHISYSVRIYEVTIAVCTFFVNSPHIFLLTVMIEYSSIPRERVTLSCRFHGYAGRATVRDYTFFLVRKKKPNAHPKYLFKCDVLDLGIPWPGWVRVPQNSYQFCIVLS